MGLFDRFLKNKTVQNSEPPVWLYTEEELNEYEAYIGKSLGYYEKVFHEIVSPDIHLDVIIIEPDEMHPFYRLVTMGAGAYPMNIPTQLKKYDLSHAEYVIYLPQNWNINSPDEKDYWPLRALKNAGRLPVLSESWLGYGHTIQADEAGTPYAENTGFHSMMLVNAPDLNLERMKLKLSSGKTINFWQLIPLYPQELHFKYEKGADDLLDLLAETPGFPVVDISRRSVV